VFDLEKASQDPGTINWKLNLHHTQRSLDLVNGAAADLVYSGLLMELLCELLNDEEPGSWVDAGTLVFAPVNVHIYENHLDGITQHAHQWGTEFRAPEEPCSVTFPKEPHTQDHEEPGSVLRSIINGTRFHSIAEVKEVVSRNPVPLETRNTVPFPLNA
jgi:hypothetical protein